MKRTRIQGTTLYPDNWFSPAVLEAIADQLLVEYRIWKYPK